MYFFLSLSFGYLAIQEQQHAHIYNERKWLLFSSSFFFAFFPSLFARFARIIKTHLRHHFPPMTIVMIVMLYVPPVRL
jgi:hypothetical protein